MEAKEIVGFKIIPEFEKYRININGVIINRHNKIVATHKSNVLHEFLGNRVKLYNSKQQRINCLVKRLVASAFIGDINGRNVILIDTDKGVTKSNMVILKKTRNPR